MEKELKEKVEWLALTSRAKIEELYEASPSYYDVSGKYYKKYRYQVGDYVEIANMKGDNADVNGVVAVVKRVLARKDGRTIYNIKPCLSLTPKDKQGVAGIIREDYGFTENELRRPARRPARRYPARRPARSRYSYNFFVYGGHGNVRIAVEIGAGEKYGYWEENYYMGYSVREAIKLCREKYKLKHKRINIYYYL